MNIIHHKEIAKIIISSITNYMHHTSKIDSIIIHTRGVEGSLEDFSRKKHEKSQNIQTVGVLRSCTTI